MKPMQKKNQNQKTHPKKKNQKTPKQTTKPTVQKMLFYLQIIFVGTMFS